MLVNVFKKVLLSGDHAHLDNFYTIVPALCLSWVEASLAAKDRMFKQNRARTWNPRLFSHGGAYRRTRTCFTALSRRKFRTRPLNSGEAYYTDDGFAVGVAYILAILEQGSRFDSLPKAPRLFFLDSIPVATFPPLP